MMSDFYNFDNSYYDSSGNVDLTGTNPPAVFLPSSAGDPSMYDPGNVLIAPSSGDRPPFQPSATASPVQSAQPGSGILGWLGLANNVANTAVNASRTGYTTRPGVNQKATSTLGSFGTVTTTTLLVIVAVFVGVLFMLRKR